MEISVNEERSQFGDFTRTISLNKLAIAYRTKLWDYVNMFKEMFVNVFIPTTVIIAITVILGVVFYYLNNRKMKFKNAMWITQQAFLANQEFSMHPIEEKGRFHTAWVVFIVLFIGFFFNVLLYSVTTSSYLSNKVGLDPFLDAENLDKKTVLVHHRHKLKGMLKESGIKYQEH